MSTNSSIEWTNATWNPVVGCSRVSPGCDHCYAVKQSYRNEMMGHPKYKGLTVVNKNQDRHFNGVVRCSEKDLLIPLKWKKPRRVFVNSMSDLFHKDVPFEFVDKVFAVMALCPQHTFQVLTKRPERTAAYFAWESKSLTRQGAIQNQMDFMQAKSGVKLATDRVVIDQYPLSNLWLGTSIENRKVLDARAMELAQCPAVVRFFSLEPLLEDLGQIRGYLEQGIHWVIVGGESGPGARPMHPDWPRSIRDQCKAAGVAFFFKQWGAWKPISEMPESEYSAFYVSRKKAPAGQEYRQADIDDCYGKRCTVASKVIRFDGDASEIGQGGFGSIDGHVAFQTFCVGKHSAGRLLDGQEYSEFPRSTEGAIA